MLSAIIATHESEHALARTLFALVPGATEGLLSEVIVADAGSRDETAQVADIAGCRFMASTEPLGARLKAAAASARAPWLMFLRPGCVPEAGWIEAVRDFLEDAEGDRAALFRPPSSAGLLSLLRAPFASARAEQGLLVSQDFYRSLGGHSGAEDTERVLLHSIGRRRLATLAASAAYRP